MALTSSSGFGSMITGAKPVPMYSWTISVPSAIGMGRKKPVSALLTASSSPVAGSKRKMLETPV